MSASQALGGPSRCGWVLGPSLDKIVKNVAWRKHTQLVAACKSAIDKLDTLADSSDPASCSPLYGLSFSDGELVLQPLLMALDSGSAKVVEPALDCLIRLFSFGLIRCEIDRPPEATSPSIVFRMVESACKCSGLGEETIELAVLKLLLSAVRSPCTLIRGDCLLDIVRTCYNVYLGGLNGTNQICAKAVLAQMMVIIFARVEEDSMLVNFKKVSVAELLEFTDRNLNEGSSIQFVQNFIHDVVEVKEGVADSKLFALSLGASSSQVDNSQNNQGDGEMDGTDSGCTTKIREDGFLLFKNLCKLSMKFSAQDQNDDQILLRGKGLSLELLKVIIDNAGQVWRNNERFLNAIKQYLCLSLLKNSALSVMTIFLILCSIFKSLLSKFRSGLKVEIGVFFPMLILRVLENVLQPSFLQKMTVLHFLEKISGDSQIVIDIFVNYDCDVDAPNIFERTVNGLLKTALGPPPGSTTTLSPSQDATFRLESVKCLVKIIESMGIWMDQQLKIQDFSTPKGSFSDSSAINRNTSIGEEGVLADAELHTEANLEFSDAALLEQRRAYKLELQKGVSLFNRKPSKGISYLINTKKVGDSPEAVAVFLKNTAGLNEAMIGDYLGDREEFPLKTMHAYVDSFNFRGLSFGEAIRYFLRGFRLPGEAQKIDRIMEKFAEHFCKCNPDSFSSADTAYVLAYSVIMLNTDAHNNMVKEKMSKSDFIRNNRGINDGKDLPEEYLGALYDQVVKSEIRMSSDSFSQENKNNNSLNRLLGLDSILNLVWKQTEEKPLGANGLLVKHIQDQFKAKSGKSESVYYAVADAAILRFMMEVCWGPMLAAFSMTLDQSDDRTATSHCLQGFIHAVHVTAVTGMQTQRDAFVTTVAKFTYLHCAADLKQKNVDAVKAIIAIAIEDGNYLQEAWEHILTCLSRFEHLQLLGEGVPSDSSFFTAKSFEAEEKILKSTGNQSLNKKGTLQNLAMAAAVRGGSYDSATLGVNTSGLVTQEQMTNFISNLNLLEQIGNSELNHIFSHSQRLDSEAIVAFVRSLCKVSMSELQSPTDPRVFSLIKIVEVAHYSMNRIRLVWSRIWSVLSDFFVSVGLSENLSVEIFVMDSLRQLSMKFLEREELTNYNFQNEFLRPFVIIMQKNNSAEIRELIVRCVSQMVLSRVNNVKSGWKSVFMVFTAAAADDRKNIVLLAFETLDKIVNEYFPYITETEAFTFTDCVKCLITFTNIKVNSDISLNAIALLRFCADKFANGDLECNDNTKVGHSAILVEGNNNSDGKKYTYDHDHTSYWIPLLTGLSSLASDPRSAIRKSSVQVLFNILMDHGHIFSQKLWESVLNTVVFTMFSSMQNPKEMQNYNVDQSSPTKRSSHPEGNTWDSETCIVAVQCLVDLFISFFNVMRPQLSLVVSILGGFIKCTGQGSANTGVAALMSLASKLGDRLLENEWGDIFLALKDAAASPLPAFLNLLRTMDILEVPEVYSSYKDLELYPNNELTIVNSEDDNLQTAAYVVSRTKSHISTQLLILQVITDLCAKYHQHQPMSPKNTIVVLDIYSLIASHAHNLNSETSLQIKLQRVCSSLQISDPPVVHFENESYQSYLNFLMELHSNNPSLSQEMNLEPRFFSVCVTILEMYLNCSSESRPPNKKTPPPVSKPVVHWILPLSSVKKEELAARTPLIVATLQALLNLERDLFRRHALQLFPILVDLVRSEHSSGEVQGALRSLFQSCIGPMLMTN